MNGRRTLAAIAAATLMMAISLPASSHHSAFDCGDPNSATAISESLISLSNMLRCDGYNPDLTGMWNPENPIWEKGAAPSCEIHERLAKKLYEARSFGGNSKPRFNKNNDATGAAWDVRNGKYEAAILKLIAFASDIDKSRINRAYLPDYPDGEPDPLAAEYEAMKFKNAAEDAQICINQLIP